MKLTLRKTRRGWCKVSAGAAYAGVSVKVFRGWLKNGLRHSRLDSNRILVSYDAIDEYLSAFEVQHNATAVAQELVEGL
jgi:hypothetical protein